MRGFFNKRAILLTRLAGMVVQQANEPKPEPVGRSTSAPVTFSAGYLARKPALFPKEHWSVHCNSTRGRRPRGCRSKNYSSLSIFRAFVWSKTPGGHLEFVRKPANNEASASGETYAIKA